MAQESLADLLQHLRLAQRQIGAVVGYANLIAGQGEMFLQSVDLAIICQRAADQSPRPIEVDIVGSDLPVVQGDRLRLADAMGYLIDNACKFSPSESTVKVKLWFEEDTIRFEVSDQGVGIPADRLVDIWQPFTQQAETVRRGVEGLGLGLPLVYHIAKAHGGETWVKSKVGQGSRFGFWLPVQ